MLELHCKDHAVRNFGISTVAVYEGVRLLPSLSGSGVPLFSLLMTHTGPKTCLFAWKKTNSIF